MSAAHQAQRLDQLRTFLRTGQGLSADHRVAIAGDLDRYFEKRISLDEAMGVKLDHGESHPGEVLAITARDKHLRAAAAFLGEASWANFGKLATILKRYETIVWPRERGCETCPPEHVGRIEEHLWAAQKAWPGAIGQARIKKIVEPPSELKAAFDFHGGNGRSNPPKG